MKTVICAESFSIARIQIHFESENVSRRNTMDERENGEQPILPRGRVLPLNSRRLTAVHVRQLAKAMGVPTEAATDEVCQMIEGKLAEDEREPRNVQVVMMGEASLALWDDNGEFLRAEPEEQRDDEPPALTSGAEFEEEGEQDEVEYLRVALRAVTAENEGLKNEVRSLNEMVRREKARAKEMWRANCEYLAEHDELTTAKDAEIEQLKAQLASSQQQRQDPTPREFSHPSVGQQPSQLPQSDCRQRRGKAPPVDPFTGESEVQLDDWIPALKRASVWNGWSEDELLLQLAGHLRGRALQEWNLLDDQSKATYSGAIEALRTRLDGGNKTLAAQDLG